MGAFDDLIPAPGRSRTGAFEDLIPNASAPAAAVGAAPDLDGTSVVAPEGGDDKPSNWRRIWEGAKRLNAYAAGSIADTVRGGIEATPGGKLLSLLTQAATGSKPETGAHAIAEAERPKPPRFSGNPVFNQPPAYNVGPPTGDGRTAGDMGVLEAAKEQLKLGVGSIGDRVALAAADVLGDEGVVKEALIDEQRRKRRSAVVESLSGGDQPFISLGDAVGPASPLHSLNPTKSDVASGIAQTVEQAPGILASIATRRARPGLAVMGAEVAPREYASGREEGLNPVLAAVRAAGQTAAEVGPEGLTLHVALKTPIGKLLALGRQDHTAFTEAAKYMGKVAGVEMTGEQLSTVLGHMVDAGLADPDATLEKLGKDMLATFRQTAVQGPLMAAGARTARAVQERVDESPAGRARAVARELQAAVDSSDLSGGGAPIVSRETTVAAPQQDLAGAARAALDQPGLDAERDARMADEVSRAAGDENRFDSLIAQHAAAIAAEQKPAPLPVVNTDDIPFQEERAAAEGANVLDEDEPPLGVGVKKTAAGDLVKRDAGGRIVGGFGADHLNAVNATVRRMATLAKEGKVGRPWYQASAKALLAVSNGDARMADRLAQLLAITSAGTEVKANFTMFEKAVDQYARGEPIKVATGDKNKMIEDLLYHGIVPSTVKVDDFYRNLSSAITGRPVTRAVTDRWQFRIGKGDRSVDAGTAQQYEHTARLTEETAKRLGWPIDETQAAMWVALKARSKFDDMKKSVRESAASKYKGVSDKELRAIALEHGMTSYASEIERRNWAPPAGVQFPSTDELQAAHQTLTAEVKPSTKTAIGQRAAKLGREGLIDFQKGGLAIVGGVENYLQAFGLKPTQYTFRTGGGAYDGGIAPNMIASINADKATVDRVARGWMYVFQQDAVPYFRADKRLLNDAAATRGVFVTVSNYAPGREKAFYKHLQDTVHPGIGYTRDGDTFLILNFHGQEVNEFLEKLDAALASPGSPLTVTKAVHYGAESEYPSHDPSNEADREALLDQASSGGSPDLQARLRGWANSFERYAERKLGPREDAGAAGEQGRSAPNAVGVRRTEVADERTIVNPIASSEEATPDEQIKQIHALTARTEPHVRKLIAGISSKFDVDVARDNRKLDERIIEKSERPSIRANKPWFRIEHVRDTYRFKVVLPKLDGRIADIIKYVTDNGFEVVKPDTDKIFHPKEWGWRIAVFDLRSKATGQLVEMYFPVSELEAAKKNGGHQMFEQWRNVDVMKLSNARLDSMFKDQTASQQLYDKAWRDYLARTGQDEAEVRASLAKADAAASSAILSKLSSSSPAVTEGAAAPESHLPPERTARNPVDESTTTIRSPDDSFQTASTEDMVPAQARRGEYLRGVEMPVSAAKADAAGLSEGSPPRSWAKHGINKADPDHRKVLAGAIEDLYARGLPSFLIDEVSWWGQYTTQRSNNAEFYPQNGGVGIRFDILQRAVNGDTQTQREIRSYIAHETQHLLDHRGFIQDEDEGELKDTISGTSPRLEFEIEGNGIDDPTIAASGDLMAEALDVYNAAQMDETPIGSYLSYPLDGIHQMSPSDVKNELFAQVGALYFTNRGTLKRLMPKWYDVMEKLYGEKVQADDLATARARLQQALQVEGSDERDQGGRAPREDQRGAGERITSQGVAGRAGPGAGGTGGGAQPPAGNRRGPAAGGVNWNVEQPGVGDTLTRALQNNQVDLKAVLEAIREAGGVVHSAKDPYLTEELAKSRYSDGIKTFDDKHVTPLLKEMKRAGVTAEDLGKYLWARHVPEANARLATINPGLADGAGMSNAEAARIMGSAAPAMRQLAARVDAMIKATRQLYVQEGLESAATVREWEQTFQHYVPLHREIENPSPGPGQGFKIRGPESKLRMGSQRPAVAILAAVVAKHHNAIIRAEKARVGRDLIKLAEQFPNPDFWRVDQPPLQRYVNPSTGLVEMRIDPMYKMREDVFVVKEKDARGNIVERVLAFNPHNERAMRLSHAMQKLDVAELGAITKTVAVASRFFANLATQWNPVFWATNAARDVGTMAVNLQSTPLRGKAPHVMARIPQALFGIGDAVWHNGTSKYAKLWREFEQAGGPTGFYKTFENILDRQKDLEKMVDAAGRSNADPRVWAKWSAEQISNTNKIIENSTRLAVYSMAREKGMSERDAASLAKNITVNFDRRGNMSAAAGAWYMFFNANIQGTARMLVGLAKSPRAQATVGVMTALGAAQYIINMMIGDRDKDEAGNNPYELISDFEKQRNWIFMLPKGSTMGSPIEDAKKEIRGRYFKIPLPYGFNIFPSLGRIAAEAALTAGGSKMIGEKRGAMELAGDFANVIIDAFSPLGQTATPLQTVAPTIADPFVQVMENKKFTGTNMVPERQGTAKQLPKSESYFNSNSELAKDTASWLNRISGGNTIEPGKIDIHPGHIEHVMRTLTGGPGTFAMGMFDWGKNITDRALGRDVEKIKTSSIPFVGKFYGEVDERAIEAKFYRVKEKADPIWARSRALRKAGDIDAADRLEEKNPALMEFAREVARRTFVKNRRELQLEMREVGDKPIGSRAAAKTEIRREQSKLYQEALRAYNATASEGGE